MKRYTWILVLGFGLLPLATARPEAPIPKEADPKPITVPIEVLKTKHLAVQIKVNGKGPYRVIFDTGAPMNLLNNKIAKEAELKPDPNAAKVGGLPLFGMKGNMVCKEFELGDLKLENMPCTVMDHPLLTAFAEVLGPVDGIVGFPFFARYRMEIDYKAEKMTLTPVDYKPAAGMDAMMKLMMDPKAKPPKKVLATKAVWGFTLEDKAADDEEAGVTIKKVFADTAASAAGLKPGDRLLVLDGTWTDSHADCYRAASHVKPDQEVKATIKRGEKEIELKIKPRAGF